MQKIIFFFLFLLSCFIAVFGSPVAARSPLGIGIAEPVINPSGPFAHMLLWIQSWQQEFEQTLSKWLVGMRQHPENAYWLILVSLVYGVLHAAGPGHGKAVISSYLIANNETLKRGILLSFLSSVLQAVTAIAIVLIAFFLLPARLTETANWLTNASYALVMLLGVWLLIRTTPLLFVRKNPANALFTNGPQSFSSEMKKGFSSEESYIYKPKLKWKNNDTAHEFTGSGEICAACGDNHILSPALISQKIDWKTALPAIFSSGLRPCTGAIFIMSFALLNDLYIIGSLSVLAMSLGTFVTVSILAATAVHAKYLVMKISNKPSGKFRIQALIEWLAALFVFSTGLLLFASAIY